MATDTNTNIIKYIVYFAEIITNIKNKLKVSQDIYLYNLIEHTKAINDKINDSEYVIQLINYFLYVYNNLSKIEKCAFEYRLKAYFFISSYDKRIEIQYIFKYFGFNVEELYFINFSYFNEYGAAAGNMCGTNESDN